MQVPFCQKFLVVCIVSDSAIMPFMMIVQKRLATTAWTGRSCDFTAKNTARNLLGYQRK